MSLSFEHRPYPVIHAGVARDGRIIVSHGRGDSQYLDDGASPDELKARGAKIGEMHGTWVPVPGSPGHSVVGRLGNGSRVTAEMAGFVYNDAELVDYLCGAGTYERVMPAEEVEILQLARPLYLAVAG
jgi:hypothetical protein